MIESCEYAEVLLAFESLRESEARLRSAINASGLGTFIWRVADDCMEPDARMRTLLGLPEDGTFTCDELIRISIHPIDRVRCANMFARAIEPAGPGSLHDEIRVIDDGGLARWLEFKGEVVFGDRAVRMSGVAADITDRKRREADLV
ncbi:MAG TPA: PAS domain-containing protein, partial [Vicinamibacterales bacterium]|nr:PAS domain-containing protein [Vicinamibacterales bacterium]